MSGEGTIYRRKDGRWVAAMSKGPRGSRQTLTRYCHSRSEARATLDELRTATGAAPRSLTTSAFLDSWVRDARNIRPRTRDGYANSVRNHLSPIIGATRLSDLSAQDVERMLTILAETRSPATVRHAHATLRRALGHAVRLGVISRNVASREFVDAPRVNRGEPDALTHDEADKIAACLDGSGIGAHVVFALGTGLRQGEQLGLSWADLGPLSVSVQYELERRDGKYQRVEPKTKRSRRVVPLSESVIEAIALHRSHLLEAGFAPSQTGPVFPNRMGGPLNGSWLTHRWYLLLDQAGVRRRPWKVLRATFASWLHEAGVSDRVIADLLGHARTYTTQNSYISTAGHDSRSAVGLVFDSHRDSHGQSPIVGSEGLDERGVGEPRRTRTFNQLIKSQSVSRLERAG